jgi:hypothetical protein
MSAPFPPPAAPSREGFGIADTPPSTGKRPLRLWQVLAMCIAGLIVAVTFTATNDGSDTPSRPVVSAGTCARLQRLIDDGMTRREAIDYAIIQADEPAVDGILRDMLNDC